MSTVDSGDNGVPLWLVSCDKQTSLVEHVGDCVWRRQGPVETLCAFL